MSYAAMYAINPIHAISPVFGVLFVWGVVCVGTIVVSYYTFLIGVFICELP